MHKFVCFYATMKPRNTKFPKEIEMLKLLSNPTLSQVQWEAHAQTIPSNFNWAYFSERAIATNLAAYLLWHEASAKKAFPEPLFKTLQQYQQRIQIHTVQLVDTCKIISEQFQKHQIEHAFLKGMDLLFRGKIKMKFRQISDIDILIHPNQVEQVSTIFSALGAQVNRLIYKSKWHENHTMEHAPLQAVLNGCCIDVHVMLFRKHMEYIFEPNFIQNNRQQISFQNNSFCVLDELSSSLFVLLHVHIHLYFGTEFKVAGLNDLYQIDIKSLENEALKWNAKHSFQEISKFWNFWNEQGILISEQNSLYQTAIRFLIGRKMNNSERIHFFKTKFFLSNGFKFNGKQLFYNVFPSKAHMIKYYGQGPYLFLWLRRVKQLFHF